MHSSRMRTARSLTIMGGVPAQGVSAQGGVPAQGGVYLARARGMYLPGGVPAQGVYLSGAPAQVLPPGQNDRQVQKCYLLWE